MVRDTNDLPDDVAELKALLLAERSAHASEVEAKDLKLEAKDQTIASLEHTVHLLSKWAFGPRTEKRKVEPAPSDVHSEGWLPFAELLAAVQRVADRDGAQGSVEVEMPATPRKRSRRRTEFPEHLPQVRSTFELPEDERMCCGRPMERFGEELSKELERIELAFVHEISRAKYCCRVCQTGVMTAPGPTRPIAKGLLGTGWLSMLLVERFGNHMPYHRLEKKYEREGVSLSRSVLCRSALELGEKFGPVYESLCKEVVSEDVLFADETSVVVQRSQKGPRKKAQVWLYANKHGDQVFDYNESRGRESPQGMLADFEGYLHDDGYCVYETCLDPERVKHVACLAHVRRKFVDAHDSDPEFSKQGVDWIGQLYEIDRVAKQCDLDAEAVRALREQKMRPILEGFGEWLEVRRTQVLPKSPMGEAIGYARGRWEAIERILEDGRLELDNNRAERALRAIAVGRKNWMMIGNERGGRTASVFYSLVETCKARGIEPRAYLQDVMLRLVEGEDPGTLTPTQWKERYAEEVAERRSYVLAKTLGKLGTS